MASVIRLVGGPADGQSFSLSTEVPPPLFLVPLTPPVSALLSAECRPVEKAEYDLAWRDHWPDRAEDGAYLYRHRVKPLTAEQRQALETERQRMRTEEERRENLLNQAWKEIREERPGYPEDWRDVF